MKQSTIHFIRNVFFTTFLAFFCISFIYFGVFSIFKDPNSVGKWHLYQAFSYFFGKLFGCVFPFSLCLGFANRIFSLKKNHGVLRIIHFLITFLSYFVFMDLLFNVLHESKDLNVGELIKETLPFFIFYPLTLGVTKIGKMIFLPKEKEEYKSILD